MRRQLLVIPRPSACPVEATQVLFRNSKFQSTKWEIIGQQYRIWIQIYHKYYKPTYYELEFLVSIIQVPLSTLFDWTASRIVRVITSHVWGEYWLGEIFACWCLQDFLGHVEDWQPVNVNKWWGPLSWTLYSVFELMKCLFQSIDMSKLKGSNEEMLDITIHIDQSHPFEIDFNPLNVTE